MLIEVAWYPRLTMQISGPVLFLFWWCGVFIPRSKVSYFRKATHQWISWNRLIIVVYTSSYPRVCWFLPQKKKGYPHFLRQESSQCSRGPRVCEGTPVAAGTAAALPRSPRGSGAQDHPVVNGRSASERLGYLWWCPRSWTRSVGANKYYNVWVD